ncbi:MAG: 50S ribosomal protein L29 [Deltaproteobacteria bacterium]|nr:50S ribosomal protein L29 [Deltaproteobacteria bacterium]
MKPSEVRDMTVEELVTKESDLDKELFALRVQNSTGHLENPLKIRFVRRDIARVKTVIAEKERERGQ